MPSGNLVQEPLNEKVLVLDKIFIECGCKTVDGETSVGGDQASGIEIQRCLEEVSVAGEPSGESHQVDEVAEEASESFISIMTLP